MSKKKKEATVKEYYTPEIRKLEVVYKKYLETHPLPVPTKEQVEWLETEIGMFIHFGINTFYNKEWSDGTLDISKYNPSKLDCESWVKTAKDLGAGYMILTAKHHDGFCNWPTETTEYSVKNTPFRNGKGDVVKDFIAACKKYDMKIGLYLSPWDRNQIKNGCYNDEKAYDEFYCKQLTELLTWYDTDFFEIWFDGAGSEGHKYNWGMIVSTIRKYQPKALLFGMGDPNIRWVGNEAGYAYYPNWCVLDAKGGFEEMEKEEIEGVGLKLKEGYGFGNKFIPAECDVPIRKYCWFYHTNNRVLLKSLKHLIGLYEKSVGRGSDLLLNVAPNRKGLIEPSDAHRVKQLGDLIRKRYSAPIAHVSGVEGQEVVELVLETPAKINCIITQEEISEGQRIREYTLEYKDGEQWIPIYTGLSIGHKKIDHIEDIIVQKIRIKVNNALKPPIIKAFAVHYVQ